MTDLKNYIRLIPDFPKKGILFRDITTLLQDKNALQEAVEMLTEKYRDARIDKVVGIESRGFILGAALAHRLGAGFVLIRKPGKLPGSSITETYTLEYGSDTIEIHTDAIARGERILMHDDLLATGGTMSAACKLVERLEGEIIGISFLIELVFLEGRKKFNGRDIHALISYTE